MPVQPGPLVPFDLSLNGQPTGTIDGQVSGSEVFVDRARVIEVLQPLLDPRALQPLQRGGSRAGAPAGAPAGASPAPLAALSELTAIGIEASFDAHALVVSISVPRQLRGSGTLSILGRAPSPIGLLTKPADFSAYVNLRAHAEARLDTLAGVPFSFSVGPVVNLFGWVVEADTAVDLSPGGGAALNVARVVKDFPSAFLRVTAGTLFLPVTGFMKAPILTGVEVVHEAAWFLPGQPAAAVEETLTLDSATTVGVSLNGRLLRSFGLEAGPYRILDIPFATGINDLVIAGEHRTVPWDSRLVPAGQARWSASAGIPQWTLQLPIVSGFFLYGLSPFLTAGANLQAGADRQTAGAEVLAATPWGTFHGVAGVSAAGFASPDFSALVDYRLAFPGAGLLPTLGLAAQYTGRGFLGPGATDSTAPYSWQVSGALGQALPFGFGLNVGLGWRAGWVPGTDSTGLTLTVTRPMGQGTTLTVLVSAQFPQAAAAEVTGTILLSSSVPGQWRTVGMSSSVTDNTASVDVHAQPGGPGSPAYFGTLGGFPDWSGGVSGSVGTQVTLPFLDAALYDLVSGSSNTLALDLGTAVVTAGGAVGVSEPVTDSFAIIIPRENMRDQRVVARPGVGSAGAVAAGGRPGVLGAITSYAPLSVTVEAPEAPPGTDPGDYLRVLQPSYKSGTAIVVGRTATVYVQGRVLTADGRPAALQGGQVVPQDTAGRTRNLFYTDEDGFFEVYGLAPGSYALTLGGVEGYGVTFSIPGDASGLFDAGTLTLTARDQKGQ